MRGGSPRCFQDLGHPPPRPVRDCCLPSPCRIATCTSQSKSWTSVKDGATAKVGRAKQRHAYLDLLQDSTVVLQPAALGGLGHAHGEQPQPVSRPKTSLGDRWDRLSPRLGDVLDPVEAAKRSGASLERVEPVWLEAQLSVASQPGRLRGATTGLGWARRWRQCGNTAADVLTGCVRDRPRLLRPQQYRRHAATPSARSPALREATNAPSELATEQQARYLSSSTTTRAGRRSPPN